MQRLRFGACRRLRSAWAIQDPGCPGPPFGIWSTDVVQRLTWPFDERPLRSAGGTRVGLCTKSPLGHRAELPRRIAAGGSAVSGVCASCRSLEGYGTNSTVLHPSRGELVATAALDVLVQSQGGHTAGDCGSSCSDLRACRWAPSGSRSSYGLSSVAGLLHTAQSRDSECSRGVRTRRCRRRSTPGSLARPRRSAASEHRRTAREHFRGLRDLGCLGLDDCRGRCPRAPVDGSPSRGTA
jgi:hypothetical protein